MAKKKHFQQPHMSPKKVDRTEHELCYRVAKKLLLHFELDKISFLIRIDFEQIPTLKQALIYSGIWKTKEVLDRIYFKDEPEYLASPIDPNKTLFVKIFLTNKKNITFNDYLCKSIINFIHLNISTSWNYHHFI